MPFQTQNSIKNKYCLEWEGIPGRLLRIVGPGSRQEPAGYSAAYAHQSDAECTEINKTNRKKKKKKKKKIIAIPNVLSFHTGLRRVSISSHPKMYGWCSKALLYGFPLLIVNSVNEVNLINFRAGSHMTFSSIFSPTSKTSISSSKIGRSEWQSTITQTYLKLRVNLFSGFWMCSLQFSKKTSK